MKNLTKRLASLASTLLLTATALAQNGTWTNTLGGNWSDTNNWLGGILANGSGSLADFTTIDIPSNTTITVVADLDPITSGTFTNGIMRFGDIDISTNSPSGNWVIADGGGLTLDSATTSNAIIHVDLAKGAANNLVTGWGTATIQAALTGTNALVKSGPNHLILNPSAGNPYSGGTVISNGMIQLGIANQAGTANVNTLGIGPVIFRGGSLRLQNAAIPGNNPGNGGAGVPALANPIIVEAGQTGTIYLSPRAFPAMNSPVSGGGTLNIIVDFVRDNLDGDWSGFNGQVKFAASTRQATSDLRFGGGLIGASLANARVNITTNGINNNNLVWYNNGAFGTTFVIGELSASIANVVSLLANNTGAGAGNSLPFVLQVGGLNTDASFSGNFTASAAAVTNGVGIIKEGTGTWTLNGATIENNGVMVVNSGILQIGSGTSGKLGRTAVITNNATLAFGRSDALVVTNIIDGPGNLLQRGTGSLILAPSGGVNTYTGKTIVTNGLLVAVPEAALGPNPASFVADQLTLSGGGLRATNNFSFADANRGITLGSAGGRLSPDTNVTLTVASVIGGGGSLTVNGAGTAVLTGANTYSGRTILTAGTLALSGESFLGPAPGAAVADQITFSGGTLRSTTTFAIDDNNRGVTIGASGGTISPDAATTLTLSRPIVGAGTLTKSGAGTLVLNGTDSRTGSTLINQGTLALSASASISASPVISVADGATLDVSALGSFSPGTGQTLAGNGSVIGSVTVGSGSTLSAGTSVGALNFANNLTLSGGTNFVEISSSTNDVINVTGNLVLSGLSTIHLNLLSPLPAGTYPLIKYGGTLSGGVANLTLAGYPISRITAALVHNAGTKSIDLVLSGALGDMVWTGGLNGNAWDLNTTPNWLNGAAADVFLSSDNVTFNNIGSTNPTVNLVGALLPTLATVNSASDYTFAGSGRISGLASLSKAGAGRLTVLTTNDYAGTTAITGGTVQVGNGTAAGSLGSGNVLNDAALTFNLPGSVTVGSAISGSGSLTVAAGTAVLTGNNSYGATIINSGTTVQVGNNGGTGSLGVGPVTDNGALVYRRTGTVTNAGSIGGSGSLSVQGSGTVVLAANNSYAGPTTIDTGTLRVGAGGTSGSLGTAASVTLTNSGTVAFNRSDSLTNIVAILGTNGTLAQVGTGTLVITNDNNDYGPTLVSAGRLQLGDGVNASGTLGRGIYTVNSPGTLVFNRPDQYTLTNRVAGNGGLAQISPTNLMVTTPSGANTYSGGTTISNSTVVLTNVLGTEAGAQTVNNGGLGTGTITFQGNSTLELAAANAQDPFGNGTGNFANPVNVPAGQTATLWLPGRFEMSGAVSGAGTINLGVNYVRGNYTGVWTNFTGQLNVISNGVNPATGAHDFRVFNALGFPNARVRLDTSSLFWRGAANAVVPIGELSGIENAFIGGTGGAEGGNAVTWRVGRLNTDATYTGTSGGSVAVGFIKEGTGRWTLTGVNSHLGNTTISNGILSVADAGSIAGSANIIVASPGLLVATNAVDGAFHLGGLSASALGGNSALVGDLVVEGFGIVSPGFSIGNFTVTGHVTNRGQLFMEINRHALPNCDTLTATGLTNESGSLIVTNIGAGLRPGDSFRLLVTTPVANNITGPFGTVTLPPLAPGFSWNDTSATDGRITVIGSTPTLTNVISGSSVSLSWGAAYLGWRLQVQTNAINVGISTNWVDVPGSEAATSATDTVNPANPSVFYRLVY